MPHQLLVDKTINSTANPLVREWRECLQSKGIKKHGLFFISGERAVRESLKRFPELARSIIVTSQLEGRLRDSETASQVEFLSQSRNLTKNNQPKFSIVAVSGEIFNELDVAGTDFPLLLMRTPQLEEFDFNLPPKGLELVCALGDPANLGALIRSAAAFGVSKIILLQESASPFHPKAVRAASATTLLTPLLRGPSVAQFFSRAQMSMPFPMVALDMHGIDVANFQWPLDVRLVLGEEGQGVPKIASLKTISIPMRNDVESLNATIAATLAMYAYRSRLKT